MLVWRGRPRPRTANQYNRRNALKVKSREELVEVVGKKSERAVMLARKRLNMELDYSENSVQFVERILAGIFAARRKYVWARFLTKPLVGRYADVWGSYLGEVMRRQIGGQWSLENYPGQPNVPVLVYGKTLVAPISKVSKRLTNGPEDNVWFYFQTIKKIHSENTGPFFSDRSSI